MPSFEQREVNVGNDCGSGTQSRANFSCEEFAGKSVSWISPEDTGIGGTPCIAVMRRIKFSVRPIRACMHVTGVPGDEDSALPT